MILPHPPLMALYMVGIGLNDEKDITLRGLEVVKASSKVFLENYTSILNCTLEKLESLYGKKILIADRDLVEKNADQIIEPAKTEDVAFLVVGDPMGATTHIDLVLRARKVGVDVKYINNASIMNAIGVVGLELYKYGKTTSVVFPDPKWKVDTPYDVIKQNQANGLHTLCLLDIKVKEPSSEDIRTEKNSPQKPKFMTVLQGIQALLDIESRRQEKLLSEDTLMIGCARIGSEEFIVKAGSAKDLLTQDFGAPLHSLIVPGKLHFIEEEAIEQWK